MPSTFSPALRIELIASGSQTGVWGNTTNNNLGDLVEQAITGATEINVTAADVTLTALNGVTDQARSAVLIVTGTAGVTRVVTIPNANKAYTVKNRSDATVQIKTSGGTAFDVPTLSESYLYCDGADAITGRVITDGANAVTSLPNPFNNAALTGVPTAPSAAFGTDTTQVATTEFVQAALQAVFPVGSVYINANVATSPTTLLGFGVWAEIGAGRVLIAQDVSDPLFDTLGNTGGTKDATLVSHSHTTSGSGTTGNNNVGHNHTFSGDTGNNNVNHSHAVSDPGHNHAYTQAAAISPGAAGSLGGGDGNLNTSISINIPNRFTGITLGLNSANHIHAFSGTTENNSVNHVHPFSFTGTTNVQGSSATNANIQPFLTVKMWKRTA